MSRIFAEETPAETGHVCEGLDGQKYTGTVVNEGMVDLGAIVRSLENARKLLAGL
jgi:hypothetical protein